MNSNTLFQQKKVTTRVEAGIIDNEGFMAGLEGLKLNGYEIHMGKTEYSSGCIPFIKIEKIHGEKCEKVDGIRNERGSVFGTYIHGIFDNIEFTKGFINNLRLKKGLSVLNQEVLDYKDLKENQYNMLANILRENLDMNKIYKIIDGY